MPDEPAPVDPPVDEPTTEEPPTEEPPVEVEAEPKRTREETILYQMNQILAANGGLESNIPADPKNPHEYWLLQAELRAIRATR